MNVKANSFCSLIHSMTTEEKCDFLLVLLPLQLHPQELRPQGQEQTPVLCIGWNKAAKGGLKDGIHGTNQFTYERRRIS